MSPEPQLAWTVRYMPPSVTFLQKLIRLVEIELTFLDVSINARKSTCMRIGPRHNVKCADITAYDGVVIPWVTVCRYLEIYIVSGNVFKCDFSNVKKSLFKSFNGVFGKIVHRESADVIVLCSPV